MYFFFLSLLSSGLSHNVLFWFKVKCLWGYGWYFKIDDDSVFYTADVLCGGILGRDRETAAFNKYKHCSSLTGIVNLNNIKFWGKTWASFTLNLLIKVRGWRNLGLLNQLMFWSLKGKGINQNLSKYRAAFRNQKVTSVPSTAGGQTALLEMDLSSTTQLSQHLTALHCTGFFSSKRDMLLIYCQKVKIYFQYQLPFPEPHSACSSSKAGFTMLTCRFMLTRKK